MMVESWDLPQSAGRRAQPVREKATAYAWYVAFVMMLVQLIAMLDRQALVILAEPIKRDLQLRDTEIGLLTGVLFTFVYAVSGFPLARLADRYSRTKLIMFSIFAWSALTAAGGFTQTFWFLAASRMGVAIGESSSAPAAHALLTNYFPPAARGRALSLIMAGAPLGILGGLGLAGWLNDLFDWRIALFVVGAPGMLVAFLVLFTVREVERPVNKAAGRGRYSLLNTVELVVTDRVLRNLLIGISLYFVLIGGFYAFTAAFIMRRFGYSATEVGVSYGVVVGVAGVFGSLAGGWITDKLSPRDTSAPLRLFGYVILATVVVAYFLVSTPTFSVVLAMTALMTLLFALYSGPTFTTLQARVEDGQRATATTITLFALSGVGSSLGPLIVGLVSDYLAVNKGPTWEPLRIGLLCLTPFAGAAAFFFFRSAHAAKQGLGNAHSS